MTSGLRKAHKIIWIVLVLIVPVLIVFSVTGIKEPLLTDSDLVLSNYETANQSILEDEHFSISLKVEKTVNKLQIILKRPLKSASAVVFGISSKANKEEYLGTIDRKGVYTFNLRKATKGIRIYDGLKEIEILNIKL